MNHDVLDLGSRYESCSRAQQEVRRAGRSLDPEPLQDQNAFLLSRVSQSARVTGECTDQCSPFAHTNTM